PARGRSSGPPRRRAPRSPPAGPPGRTGRQWDAGSERCGRRAPTGYAARTMPDPPRARAPRRGKPPLASEASPLPAMPTPAPPPPRSRPAPASHRIQVAADRVQVAHVAGQHALERAPAAEDGRRIGLADPRVRRAGIRKEDLQRLVDPEQIG